MSDDWQPSPPDNKFIIERWGHNSGWARCSFEELRKGDVIRVFSPEGEPINPMTREIESAEAHTTAIAEQDAFKNFGIEDGAWHGEPIGYICPIRVTDKEQAN